MNKKMNPEIKEKWLAALRSGEYQKGELALKRRVEEGRITWCCLGVLCDLYIKETGEGSWKIEKGIRDTFISGNGVESGAFPSFEVMKWAGLDSINGIFTLGEGGSSLSKVNDESEAEDFRDVIPIIEEHF